MSREEWIENLTPPLILLAFVWFSVNLSGFVVGLMEHKSECDKPMKRIEILFPGQEIGCWVSEPILKKE